VPCFPCKAALLNLASSWLGPYLATKGPFDRAMLMLQSPYLHAALLNHAHLLCARPCLLSTKVFDTALHMSKFLLSLFGYWSPTLYPQPFLFLSFPSWPQTCCPPASVSQVASTYNTYYIYIYIDTHFLQWLPLTKMIWDNLNYILIICTF
jgi:hypothetical protein